MSIEFEHSNAKIMEKIRKCLALSESSNEHEAAAALRQAHKLMKMHELNTSDLDIFKISKNTLETTYNRKPTWYGMLATIVAVAFSCSLFESWKKFLFVGRDAAPEIAIYSLEVLSRQLLQQKAAFLKTPELNIASPGIKRKASLAFCEGWVIGINRIVREFAAPLSEREVAIHREYLEMETNKKIGKGKEVRGKNEDDPIKDWAIRQGHAEGKKVQLHVGMQGPEQLFALGYSHDRKTF